MTSPCSLYINTEIFSHSIFLFVLGVWPAKTFPLAFHREGDVLTRQEEGGTLQQTEMKMIFFSRMGEDQNPCWIFVSLLVPVSEFPSH